MVFEDGLLTYRELNARANRLADDLDKLAVGPETLVGLCLERSLEMIVGILGVLKPAGLTFHWTQLRPRSDSRSCWRMQKFRWW